jgi:hypothetical protein
MSKLRFNVTRTHLDSVDVPGISEFAPSQGKWKGTLPPTMEGASRQPQQARPPTLAAGRRTAVPWSDQQQKLSEVRLFCWHLHVS